MGLSGNLIQSTNVLQKTTLGYSIVSRGQTSIFTGPYRLQYKRSGGAYTASDNARAKKEVWPSETSYSTHQIFREGTIL